jgi:hypothetical protein
VDAGPDGVGLKVQASVADDPYLLPETRPAVLGKAIDVRYFEFESQVTSGELRAVAITMDLRALGLPKGVAHPDVRFYYWVGDRWVAIDSANVIGQGEPDLVVLDRNVDSAKGQATLTVNHLSAYALALQDLTAPANASEAPAPSAALVMVGLAAVLAGLRHRGWDGRR